MFARVNMLAIGLLAFTVPLVTAQDGFAKFQNFSQTCTNITLSEHWNDLSAACKPIDPSRPVVQNEGSPLELNLCIGWEEDHGLEWSVYGKFGNECNNCTLNTTSGVFLECDCEGGRSSLDLDTGIGNVDGVLTCYTTGPTVIPPEVTSTAY
ncbi:hypothetical protein QBC41DRAFT_15558 [Cercophora samala]|uniref:Cyanovirin-N domain-containing protein n=1 Tax=Cercophora samala TaxID=330535 RepID=A0AA40D869_9PEZI|nr:hypothetical protein QBC41DRAFT_15558 [Cercophora samala]